MANQTISRRSFLRLCAIASAGMAFRPFYPAVSGFSNGSLGRVAIYSVSVYSEPNDKSRIICQRYRDEVLNLYYEVVSKDGPSYNPRWYRVWQGYVHSAHIQRVWVRPNPIPASAPEKPALGEITVPYTQTQRQILPGRWEPIYRLYYGSTHWVVGIEPGPDGQPWARLRDELLEVEYSIAAPHIRMVTAEELAPISPNIPAHKKRIEVSLQNQTLTAYEYDQVVLQTKISSGIPGQKPSPTGIPTKTPTGEFHIENKMPSKHMGDGNLTDDLQAYELPGVPWTSFFELKTGVATHGTYWHDNFGIPMSHGCVNMRTEEAKWIYRWATPTADFANVDTIGYGTYVVVR
ncbi:MAG TPA: L,D-transpeptidase [Anaerolineaceae bacterium]